ncbi:MAG: HAMP domain-containing sensor histidine kinase [Balneolaceae bacterium]
MTLPITKKLNQELTELNRYKDKLFSVIAHDLRNPVAGLVGLMDMIHDEFESLSAENLFEYLTTLRRNSKNTYKLLEDLLQWARSQYEQLILEPTLLNIADTTDEVINNLANQAGEKEISLQNKISEDLWIEADENMLKTILRNLVSNAIKFSSAGDSVKIKAAKRQEEIRISIIDEGKGIKKENQNKILTKSVTYTTRGTNGEKGSGLGLDLCLDFVERHGGELQFESEPGKGSTFTVILPEKQETEAKVNTP